MYALNIIPFPRSTDWILGNRRVLSAKCRLHIDVPKAEKKLVERIRERITNGRLEISPSAYDTAWVAMVPSREHPDRPSFPQCLDWIIKNQNPNGSWGLDPGQPLLIKDSLSCTLACLLALRKWNTGNPLMQSGMDFIESHIWAATDHHSNSNQLSPIGFNIIFPSMINYAKELDLTLPFLDPSSLDSLLRIRDSEIRKRNWEYVAEGVVHDSCHWKQILDKHQITNGSLFNSPATTAAAAIHSHDHRCLEYLISILKHNDGWVPTTYPCDIYARLCIIDTLEKLGIDRHFEVEVSGIFEDIYRKWQERDEEIFGNVTCQAMAFRLLRIKGYDVSSDELSEFMDEDGFFNGVSMQESGDGAVLELYRASHARINEEEQILEKIYAWTIPFLKQRLLNRSIRDGRLEKQVEYDLKNFYGALDRFQNRRSIDLYDAKSSQIAKTAYRFSAVYNEDLIQLSVQDFKISRAQYLEELEQMNKWYSDYRLDLLTKGRSVCREVFILTAAAIVDPHLSMARITYAKVALLIGVMDDFFDHYGSKEEVFSIIHLVKEWKPAGSYCSEEVEILFTAVYDAINEIAANAYAVQGYCCKQQLINLWLELLECQVKENESLSGKEVTTLEEYLSFAPNTIGCKTCVCMSIHFLGIKLSEEIWNSEEFISLCKHAAIVCRLLNDLKTNKREAEQSTHNGVNLQREARGISEEEAVAEVKEILEFHRRKVMQHMCRSRGSTVPRACKELVWKTCAITHCFYGHDGGDEYSSPKDIIKDINAMMFEPLD